MFTLRLEFDEDDISQRLRPEHARAQLERRKDAVAVRCTLLNASGFEVDSFHVDAAFGSAAFAKNTDGEQNELTRGFFYLNGLLRALNALKVRNVRRGVHVRRLRLETSANVLIDNVSVARIGAWKRRGYKSLSHSGDAILYRDLWNRLYEWMTSAHGFIIESVALPFQGTS